MTYDFFRFKIKVLPVGYEGEITLSVEGWECRVSCPRFTVRKTRCVLCTSCKLCVDPKEGGPFLGCVSGSCVSYRPTSFALTPVDFSFHCLGLMSYFTKRQIQYSSPNRIGESRYLLDRDTGPLLSGKGNDSYTLVLRDRRTSTSSDFLLEEKDVFVGVQACTT